MFFIGRKTTVDLQLTTPLDFCCNCGAAGDIGLVETPLQKTKYFLFFGTELELRETFPYCSGCRRTARRVRLGRMSKLLVACMVAAAAFLVLVLCAASLPAFVQGHLFATALALGAVLTMGYFRMRESRNAQRTYYQPVSLVDADVGDEQLRTLHLRFENGSYARLFTKANSGLIAARILKVEADDGVSSR